jgi:hypothetical protein
MELDTRARLDTARQDYERTRNPLYVWNALNLVLNIGVGADAEYQRAMKLESSISRIRAIKEFWSDDRATVAAVIPRWIVAYLKDSAVNLNRLVAAVADTAAEERAKRAKRGRGQHRRAAFHALAAQKPTTDTMTPQKAARRVAAAFGFESEGNQNAFSEQASRSPNAMLLAEFDAMKARGRRAKQADYDLARNSGLSRAALKRRLAAEKKRRRSYRSKTTSPPSH